MVDDSSNLIFPYRASKSWKEVKDSEHFTDPNQQYGLQIDIQQTIFASKHLLCRLKAPDRKHCFTKGFDIPNAYAKLSTGQ